MGGMAKTAPASIRGVEILAAGTWEAQTGEVEITDEDLAAIEYAFAQTGEALPVPVRIGHDATDKDPAVGWLSNVRKVGSKLVADLVRVAADVVEAIREGRYGPRSAGLVSDRKVGGKSYPLMLDHLALLGAVQPAVSGLNQLETLLSRQPVRGVHLSLASESDMDDEEVKEGEQPMPAKEEEDNSMMTAIRAALGIGPDADVFEAITALKGASAELASAGGDRINLSREVVELKARVARYDAEKLVDEFKDRVTPNARAEAIELAIRDPKAARSWFSKLQPFVELGERGSTKDGGDFSDLKPSETEIALAKAMNGGRVDMTALMRKKAMTLGRKLPDNFDALVARS